MAALLEEKKKEIIGQYRIHEKDTGSPEVQIALLTERIRYLTENLSRGLGCLRFPGTR